MKIRSLLLLSAMAITLAHAESPVISVDRTQYFRQTDASTFTTDAKPFSFNFHVHGNSDISAWGPAFYKPGSGGTPASGSNTDTNTGTLNFSATPNNYADYLFIHDFATNEDLESVYPVAPTDGGAYGVKFLGSAPPTPAQFTDGLVFAAGTTYPSVAPQVASANNGAVWSGNTLRIRRTGVTTIQLNSFPEYSSTTYGSLITAGFHHAAGELAAAAKESGYLPMGDSTEDSDPINQPPVTEISVDGSWFTPGQVYTLEVQYAVIAGRPEEDFLNGTEFQGAAAYRKVTTIRVAVAPTLGPDFNADGMPDLVWQNVVTGARSLWLMDGTAKMSEVSLGADADINWRICGTGDFDANGTPDIIWQNISTGGRVLWMMDGTTRTSVVSLGLDPDVNWRICGAGDFDGNGTPDIIWQNISTGGRVLWMMSGTNRTSVVSLGLDPDVNWRICNAADFDGNGTPDIIWQNISTGSGVLWMMSETTRTSVISIGAGADSNWRISN